ncbi:uncharacterized protein LOC106649202 [Trichogramma pretiosum]|uniref:uncharacterized protein LOC106649202 n=1 Tax=Trichogramma pretiosum TaxID=7493 RepID=UPI0006C97F3C|nr:uncharacterized protein LOC106649202 [Trichogramma pretiosum]
MVNVQDAFRDTYLRHHRHLLGIPDTNARLREFEGLYKRSLRDRDPLRVAVLEELITNQELFPRDDDKRFFLKLALDEYHPRILDRLESIEPVNNFNSSYNVHILDADYDDKSALHYLADRYEAAQSFDVKRECYNLMSFLLKYDHKIVKSAVNPESTQRRMRIFIDRLGYNYLHGCCLVGKKDTMERLLFRKLVDDSLMRNHPRSPLHVAAQYRHAACVQVLLDCGVDPNYQDQEHSTALHALSRPCMLRCQCRAPELSYCDCRRQVLEIVRMLVEKGANLEARNANGDTPLRAAVSRLDVEVTRALLECGANPRSLITNGNDRTVLFDAGFTALETRSYPLTFNIIELAKLLESRNIALELSARLRMVKCWMRVRGNEVDHLIPDDTGHVQQDRCILVEIKKKIKLYEGLAFCQDALRYLQQRCASLEEKLSRCNPPCPPVGPEELVIDPWIKEVQPLYQIILTQSDEKTKTKTEVSLARLCEINHLESAELLKNLKDDPCATIVGKTAELSCNTAFVNGIVKRRVANNLMRPVLNLDYIGRDLFMTEAYNLNMTNVQCLEVAKSMPREWLLRLFQQTNVDAMGKLAWKIERDYENDPRAERRLWTNRSFFTDESKIFECLRNHCRAVARYGPYRLF